MREKNETFSDKQKLRELVTTKFALQEILKCPVGQNVRTLNSKLDPCGEIKISIKVNQWEIIKASIFVTYFFLHDLIN